MTINADQMNAGRAGYPPRYPAEAMVSVPESVRAFWDAFQAPVAYDAPLRFYEVFHFDDNVRAANSLVALVLSGQKRANAGLLWVNEVAKKPLPTLGALSVVTDWQGAPQCIIETTDVKIVPYDNVTESFAVREGEGDKTLGYWRHVHWRYFSRECERIGRAPDPQMPVVCELFKVVYPASD